MREFRASIVVLIASAASAAAGALFEEPAGFTLFHAQADPAEPEINAAEVYKHESNGVTIMVAEGAAPVLDSTEAETFLRDLNRSFVEGMGLRAGPVTGGKVGEFEAKQSVASLPVDADPTAVRLETLLISTDQHSYSLVILRPLSADWDTPIDELAARLKTRGNPAAFRTAAPVPAEAPERSGNRETGATIGRVILYGVIGAVVLIGLLGALKKRAGTG